MAIKIVVPELGESVLEATVGHWRKNEGDHVSPGEVVVELETDKVDLEVGAEHEGVLAKIERKEGEDVRIGDVLAIIEEGAAAPAPAPAKAAASQPEKAMAPSPAAKGASAASSTAPAAVGVPKPAASTEAQRLTAEQIATPSARRLARERGVNLAEVTLPESAVRVTSEEVRQLAASAGGVTAKSAPQGSGAAATPRPVPSPAGPQAVPLRREERTRMSRRRMTIAQRLVEAQHTAAILTTFNEIDMSGVMEFRKRQKEAFKQRYGVNLGVVSFFVKASIAALKQFPRLNAEVQGDEMVLKHYYDIGVAVGASEGLVVPILRDADRMSFAEIEMGVKEYARKAQDGTLTLADLRGGTFSITNGGVFGSLLSTPILNPPQVGILGLHKIQERPVASSGAVVLRPMMYVALSYDHRIVDGLEAVQFLVRVKELVEEPAALLLES
ncbi:MAG TPA: 2-oxoglutarate dehydrogenase complex dihydrolipoyllysine-residue succinyltransferase [Terriglobia bacterium]|nr:2-oxoglutarate dehydrogenase complex dihydrolipoyllysine-residue succinyltransferase [Terriglobia bacterium]